MSKEIHKVESAKRKDGGVVHVFSVALPLILVASSHSIKLFCDRTMLSHYSNVHMEASFSAGITYFTMLVFFVAMINYCNVFVSQYFGAGDNDNIGRSVWQGIIAAIIAWLILGSGFWWAESFFSLIGRDAELQQAQISYVRILFATSGFSLIMAALNSFWAGRGQTWMVLVIEIVSVVLNITFNYIFIFGKFGFPELGIVGAACGTALSVAIGTVFAAIMFFNKSNRIKYQTWPSKIFDPELFKRLLKFGAPSGVRAMLDVGAFNIFIIILSYYSAMVAQSSTITFAINALVFIPLFGLGNSISILVGQAIGQENISQAKRVVTSGRFILFFYLMIAFFVLTVFEQIPLALFNIVDAELYDMTSLFMSFIAVALIFNGIAILHSSAISGAGDTKFPMQLTIYLSWGAFVLPIMLIYYNDIGVGWAWFVFVAHIVPKAAILVARYRGGKWQSMNVI